MSIIIKGLDMPKSCNECLLADRYIDISRQKVYYCMVSDKECVNGSEKRADSCPLIEIDLVRCGECKWQKVNKKNGFYGCGYRFGLVKADNDSFCPYGERRNDESIY